MGQVLTRVMTVALALCCAFALSLPSLAYADEAAAGTDTGGTVTDGTATGGTDTGTSTDGTDSGATDDSSTKRQTPVATKHSASKLIAVTSAASKGAKEATNGGKVGKKGATLKGLSLTNISSTKGSISYKVNTVSGGWTGWAKNGAAAADGQAIEAVKIKLSGKLAKKYNVYYRVYIKTYGWLGWAKNGASAGTTSLGSEWKAQSIQVKLVAKGKKAPGYTNIKYCGAKGWITKMTGDAKLDKAIYKLAQKKKTVKACYNWVKNHKHTNWYGSGKKRHNNGTRSWYASEANRMMFGKATDCYSYAATFALLANCLGYNSKAVCGYVPSRSLGQAAHSWTEIKIKGKTYAYDPDLGHSYPGTNFYKFTYKHAPTNYKIDKVVDPKFD